MKNKLQTLLDNINAYCSPSRRDQLINLVVTLGARLEDAPASSKLRYHHAWAGGLIDHINELIEYGLKLSTAVTGITAESIVTVSILHDINKIGDSTGQPNYGPNISEKTGKQSVADPYNRNKLARKSFAINDVEAETLLEFADFSDGEASLALIKKIAIELFTSLTPSEYNAVRYHDGGYGKAKRECNGKEDALVIVIHAADMLSSRIKTTE